MSDIVKMYYSISEVCEKTGLEPHVLRYWESEFSQLKPKKNRAGNRAYREKDIKLVEYIRTLLYDEKFTISGAKKKLAESRTSAAHNDDPAVRDEVKAVEPLPAATAADPILLSVRHELGEVLKLLRS